MKTFLKQCYCKVNLTKHVSDHLFGEEHPIKHRMLVGLLLMVVGVVLSKAFAASHIILHYGADVIGYFAHGIGAMPYGEYILKAKQK